MGAVAPRVLVVDNYDSFVYNLVQYLGELGAEPVVHRSDAFTLDDVEALAPDAVLISPGPGRPEDAGLSNEVITTFAGRVPILGVCLGHQCIGQIYGGDVVRAPAIMHGKTSAIHHDGGGVFAGLPVPAGGHPLPLAGGRPPTRFPTCSRSPPAPRTGWSWACATGTSTSRASSSTPSRS